MPANAHEVFKLIVQIATLDLVETEPLIEEVESRFEIKNDDFFVTETFCDFGYKTTSTMRNLQIMFVFILILVTLPVCLFFFQLILCWSRRAGKLFNAIKKRVFFNLYLRFGLEAYLELALASMLRFKNFNLDDRSAIFHSVFCLAMIVVIFALLAFSLFFLQVRFKDLAKKESKERYGALYLEIKTRERTALLHSFMFKLRRIIYATIVINWQDRNYFQIQTVIFKCSCFMIYTGYVRPFESAMNNNLELINECLVIMCSYSLIMFSSMVFDAQTRYECGWYLIALVIFTISMNLVVILVQTISKSLKHIKLRIIRAKNQAVFNQKRQAGSQKLA